MKVDNYCTTPTSILYAFFFALTTVAMSQIVGRTHSLSITITMDLIKIISILINATHTYLFSLIIVMLDIFNLVISSY
jgi:hypothetical protein